MNFPMDYFEEIIQEIIDGTVSTPDELQKAKMRLCKKYNRPELPKNGTILKKVDEMEGVSRDQVLPVLQRKPARKKSGVSVIAVMTSPAECPHGRCLMCPGGPDTEEPSPQSYTGNEPAALRAGRNEYDPYEQVKDRLDQYDAIGHEPDKIEMIIMGGTFPARDWEYQKNFIKRCFDALNDKPSDSLEEAKKINETAERRCIGLTIETRPDYCKEEHLKKMLKLGATRVEIGVQSIRDELLENIQRGHSVKDSVEATRLAKQYGFKVCYHMMPGLPGSTRQEDLEEFKQLFENERFEPDLLKIYPTLVVKGTELYEMWKRGEYEPYSTQEAADLVAEMKSIVPKYVRIQRVQRDIPSNLVDAGVKKSNLRQYARSSLKDKGLKCDCIRCREVGHSDKSIDHDNVGLSVMEYEASGGTEYFIELGEDNIIAGYARIRTEKNKTSILRELKVVGEMTPVDEKGQDFQHMGYGKQLMQKCEEIAKGRGSPLKIISGIGAREYYRKLNYELEGYYMVKQFN